MKNKYVWFLILVCCLMGTLIVANGFNVLSVTGNLGNSLILSTSGSEEFPIGMAIFMELFCSIHMSVFVLIPFSRIYFKENHKKAFWILFGIRALLLLVIDFITPFIAIVDFFAVFVGAFIVIPVSAAVKGTKIDARSNQVIDSDEDELFDSEMKKELDGSDLNDKELLMDYLVRQYADINRAFYVGDDAKLSSLCDDDIYNSYKEKLNAYKAKGLRPVVDNVDFYDVKISSFRKNSEEAFAELTIKYKCIEYVVDKYDLVVEGSKTKVNDYSKKVEFYTRCYDELNLECPNCQVKVYDNMDKCHNCGTELNFDSDWILINETIIYEK